MSVLQSGISKGNVYSLKSVWTYFCRRYDSAYGVEPETFKSDRFRTRIKDCLGDKVVFIQPLNPSESLLIISADLGEAALQSLLQENQENDANYEQGDLAWCRWFKRRRPRHGVAKLAFPCSHKSSS